MVTSREGRVSRNQYEKMPQTGIIVTSREGRVSRNVEGLSGIDPGFVTSREGRVSRNQAQQQIEAVVNVSRPARDV